MPSKNTVKEYAPESFYHIYNRGVAKQKIFVEKADFAVFLNLLKRYLSRESQTDGSGRPYPHYHGQIEVSAFCLMPNHFHLLIYQYQDSQAFTKLLQSVCTAYTMYFNRKYKRVGPLFQGRFKASRISRDEYLLHISRYIHLNPANFETYEWSSLPYYLQNRQAQWLEPWRILELFEREDYLDFLKDYEDYKKSLDEIKNELANPT